MRLHGKLEQFQGEARLSTWLYRMTVNASLDALRRFKRRQKWETSLALIVNEDSLARESFGQLDHTEMSEKLRKALSPLRKPFRAVVIIKFALFINCSSITRLEFMAFGVRNLT